MGSIKADISDTDINIDWDQRTLPSLIMQEMIKILTQTPTTNIWNYTFQHAFQVHLMGIGINIKWTH